MVGNIPNASFRHYFPKRNKMHRDICINKFSIITLQEGYHSLKLRLISNLATTNDN